MSPRSLPSRVIGAVHEQAQRAIQTVAALRERGVRVPARLPDPPIFIIGPPRSGSTVLFQLLATRFDLAYFANLHCARRGAPFLAEQAQPTAERSGASGFRSNYGQTEGPFGPSECGEYWYRFFPRDHHYVTELPAAKAQALRRSLGALVMAAGRPFLIKNLMCTTRIPVLGRLFPEALFIVLHRDEVDTAHSILEARKRLQGDYDTWFSLRTPGHELLAGRPPEEQAVEQVRGAYRTIDRHRDSLGGARFMDLDYETLCADVPGTLDQAAAWLSQRGSPVQVRDEVPHDLPQRRKVRIDTDMYERLVSYARTNV